MEFLTDVFSPVEACPSRGRPEPRLTFFSGVRPQQIAQGSLVGDILNPIDGLNLVKALDDRGKAPVEGEHLILNHC